MPPDFHLPGADVDAWVPMLFDEARFRQMRRAHWFRVIARLRPGVTLGQARDEMTRIAADLERQYPETNTQMGVGLGPLHEWLVGDLRGALLGLLGAVALVLLVACTNVAGLLLARATARRREVAIRTALGAGRLRLVRQLLTESFVLAGAGAVFGVLLANGAIGLLRRFGPEGVPRLDRAGIDLPVLIFVTVVAAATALLFGLAPAWQGSRSSSDALKDGARGATAAGARLRRLLIVGEVTLSVVLLVGAGLLVRSFDRLRQVDPGMDASRALSFRISLPEQRYDDDEQVASFYTRLTGQLRGVPGVRAAGASVRLALEGRTWTGDLFVEGKPEVWGRELRHKPVTPGYLEAAGLRLLRGRDFSGADTAASDPVVLVNETLVRQFFGAADPVVGQRLAFGRPSANTRWRTIVGVVADEKQDGLAAEVRPEVYQPHAQDPSHTMSIVVRTAVDPASMIAAIRREVAAVDPAVAIYEVRTLEEVVARSLAGERFAMLAMGVFAVVALVLAMVGLYGVVAFAVSERRREIGVRLALGARQADVLQMVVWDGVRLVLVGLAAGLACAVALGRAMAAFLFGVPPADPIVLAGVAALLGAAAVTAALVPARRASRIDPAISLRQEL
jgi:putative ABC transport system permease protein